MLLWGLTQLLSNTLGIAAIHLEFVFTNFYTLRKWQQFLSLDSVHLHQVIRFLRAEHLQIVFVPVIFMFFDGLYMYNIFNTYIYIYLYVYVCLGFIYDHDEYFFLLSSLALHVGLITSVQISSTSK